MKRIMLIISAILLLASSVYAQESFTLTAPLAVSQPATGGKIISYSIVPGATPRFVINFRWTDATGEEVGIPQSVTWSGQDFTDIFGFVIRAQDVGKTIGVGLRGLIHAKIETKYGVDIQ